MTLTYSWLPAGQTRADRWLRALAITFIAAMGFSIGGSLLLRLIPSSMALFGPYYPTLVKFPTWTYMAILPLIALFLYGPSLGWKTAFVAFLVGSGIGGASELIGTTTGVPFGPYAYTFWLGPKILEHVPYFIPPSWFAMSIVSYELAGRVTPHTLTRAPLAATFMVLWDVSLDPAMSRAFPFWTYPEGGFFYGMPLSNWAGWFVVSLAIMGVYSLLFKDKRLFHAWSPVFYLLNCAFPLTISLLYGLYGAVAAGLIATAVPLFLCRTDRKPSPVALTS
ncbi:MAG: bisanhydrobacterioruberin hydratase CruF [Rhodothermales bacterium]|nr:bisanhydrobacterioruberin hydratase CruF [Rhodothermales bacterium]